MGYANVVSGPLPMQGSQPYFGPPRDAESAGAASPTNSESESV